MHKSLAKDKDMLRGSFCGKVMALTIWQPSNLVEPCFPPHRQRQYLRASKLNRDLASSNKVLVWVYFPWETINADQFKYKR